MAKYGEEKYSEAVYGVNAYGYSESFILVGASGSSLSIRNGSSESIVIITSSNIGSPIKFGGSETIIISNIESSGYIKIQSGSESIINIYSFGNGYKKINNSSESSVIVSTNGFGRHKYIDVNINIGSDKKITFDKNYLGNKGEQALLLITVNDSFIFLNYLAYFELILTNGIIEVKGGYDYSSGKFYSSIGKTDNILSYDGLTKIQFVFNELSDDGLTRKNKKKTLIANTMVKK